MKKVVTFGELMLRLSPEGYLRFLQSEKYQATFGGAEANVAVSLANYDIDVAFVTKLPEHEIGQSVINSLRKFGVDTSKIVRGGERVGVFYCEKGASQRPGKVIYDRAYSAIAMAKKEDFDWDKIFDGVSWFHFTGITPALSDELAEICEEALKVAKSKNITVSCDINYRSKLWTKEKAKKTMLRLLPYVDYCKDLYWFDDNLNEKETVDRMIKQFGLKGVAVTMRNSESANDHDFSAKYFIDGKTYCSKEYRMHIVDRVGGGDAFSAGWIYALMQDYAPQKVIDFAVAASCLKHSIEADYNMVSVVEVNNLVGGDASGRVQR